MKKLFSFLNLVIIGFIGPIVIYFAFLHTLINNPDYSFSRFILISNLYNKEISSYLLYIYDVNYDCLNDCLTHNYIEKFQIDNTIDIDDDNNYIIISNEFQAFFSYQNINLTNNYKTLDFIDENLQWSIGGYQ